MKYHLEVRSVAIQAQSIREKHASFVGMSHRLAPPWCVASDIPAPDPGGRLSAVVKLDKMLGKGFRGELVYQFRREFRDSAAHDDYLSITFDPQKVDYKGLVSSVFLCFALAFEAYYAEIMDDDFIFKDYDRRRELGIDKRHGVFRIAPVCFLDERLCRAAFGLRPGQIVERLAGKVEEVRETANGVFIAITGAVLASAQMDPLCEEVKEVLSDRMSQTSAS